MTFNFHTNKVCRKAGQNLHALSRIVTYINIEKRHSLLNTFFISQCNFLFNIYVTQSCKKNPNKINYLHKRCLKIIWDKVFKSGPNKNFLKAVFHKFCLVPSWILCPIYNHKVSIFKQLRQKDSSASMHSINLRCLAEEMFKLVNGLAPKIFSDLFTLKAQNNHSLRHKSFLRYLKISQCVMVSKAYRI